MLLKLFKVLLILILQGSLRASELPKPVQPALTKTDALDERIKNIILKSDLQYLVGSSGGNEQYAAYLLARYKNTAQCKALPTCESKLEVIAKKITPNSSAREKQIAQLSILLKSKFSEPEIEWLANWYSHSLRLKLQEFINSHEVAMIGRLRENKNIGQIFKEEIKKAGLNLELK